MNTENKYTYYTTSVAEFNTLTSCIDNIETGIYVNGAIVIDNYTSIISKEQVAFPSPNETKRNYKKIIEMRDLTPEEETKVGIVKDYLKRIYRGIFRGKNYLVAYTLTMSLLAAMNLSTSNFLNVFTFIASTLIVLGPTRLIRETIKLITINKRREQLTKYLSSKELLRLCSLVDDDKDIKMYIKQL